MPERRPLPYPTAAGDGNSYVGLGTSPVLITQRSCVEFYQQPSGQLMLSEEDPLLEYKELTVTLSSELCRPLAKQWHDSRYMTSKQQDVLREVVLRMNIYFPMRWLQNSLREAQQFLRSCHLG